VDYGKRNGVAKCPDELVVAGSQPSEVPEAAGGGLVAPFLLVGDLVVAATILFMRPVDRFDVVVA